MSTSKKRKKRSTDDARDFGTALGLNGEVQKHGDAAKIDLDTNQDLKDLGNRGGTHGRKGFVFERVEKGMRNKQAIYKGKPANYRRTDDIGRVNDPIDDLVQVDKKGNAIPGSEEQLKHTEAEKIRQGIAKGEYDRYKKITVPKDEYKSVLEELDKGSEKERRLSGGKEKIVPGRATTDDVSLANKHRPLYIIQEMSKTTGRAALRGAGGGFVIGGSIAIALEGLKYIQGKQELSEAAWNTVKAASKSAARGGAIVGSGALIKGFMGRSKSAIAKTIAKGSLPTLIASAALETGESLIRWFKGEISGIECLEELGKKGTGMVAGAYGATIGQIVIPIPVVGAVIGGMVGWMISSQCYQGVLYALKSAKLSEEQRIIAERMSREAIREMRKFRRVINKNFNRQYFQRQHDLKEGFALVKQGIASNDVDIFADGVNHVAFTIGKELQFKDFAEFDAFMHTEEPLHL